MTVGRLVEEPLETHAPEMTAAQRRARAAELLGQVGLRPEHAGRYPHEFSGGQRQRIGIARALASGPKLIIGDEPVSALDVSVQAQVVNLLSDLRDAFDLTLVVIAHDLAVIRHMSDRVAVMYLGQIVEYGPADEVFATPRHPYTMALLSAIPEAEYGRQKSQIPLIGETPSPAAPPPGCRFHTRCPFARDDCSTRVPELRPADAAPPPQAGQSEHGAACHYWEEIAAQTGEVLPPTDRTPRPEVAERFRLYREAIAGPGRATPAAPQTNEKRPATERT
jgi:oligopeptide/dipeptide ABC transporter ATP-binding protein